METKYRLAIPTISLGWHASHTLKEKLQAASRCGYDGVEIVWTDLEQDANERGSSVEETANLIKAECRGMKLNICALVSFQNYEGSQEPLAQRLGKAHRWVGVARILDTDIIQIPANVEVASLAASDDEVIEELRMLADCGVSGGPDEKTITFAYEPMAWSIRANTWQTGLYTIRRVARPNFKLCLDTYHILAKVWGDCTSPDGKVPFGDEALKASLHDLPRLMGADEIALIQLSDVERMEPRLELKNLKPGQHYSQYWCMWGRLFPFEQEYGAYLPMAESCRCLFNELGFTGWVSMEIFHRDMSAEQHRPGTWAERGSKSWSSVKDAIGIE